MYVESMTRRIKNNYQGWLRCFGCNHRQFLGDGYADRFFAYEVIPNRKCDNCGKSEVDLINEMELQLDIPSVLPEMEAPGE
jgi:hypothetical protein